MRRSCFAIVVLGCASAAAAQQAAPPAIEQPRERRAAAVLTIPGADEPDAPPLYGPPGPPSYRPSAPPETPHYILEQATAPISSLQQALERAYWLNPQLLAERARLKSADFRLPQARAQYGPEFQYLGEYAYQRDNVEQPGGGYRAFSGSTTTAVAILNQPLFTFGRLRAGENIARGEIAFQRAQLRVREQDILFGVISAYARVLSDRTGIDIARDNVDTLARQLSYSEIRFRVRDTTSTDVQQVRTRLELARADLLAAQRVAASSEAAFLNVVGAPPASDLAPIEPLAVPARGIEDAHEFADANNPILASAYARERISRAARDGAKADLLPRIDVRGEATYGSVTPYSDELRQTQLRGVVTVSGFIDAGLRQARVGEAEAANDADWRLIDAALRENRAELTDAWNEWQTQAAAAERLGAAVDAAQQALQGVLIQEQAGLRTTLDVLEVTRDLLNVRTSYNNAAAAAVIGQARVLAAMGLLEQRSLLPDAPRYDQERHFDDVSGRGDIPLLTSAIRLLDSLAGLNHSDRPIRDPAAPLATGEASR